jgi:hypothetical protein
MCALRASPMSDDENRSADGVNAISRQKLGGFEARNLLVVAMRSSLCCSCNLGSKSAAFYHRHVLPAGVIFVCVAFERVVEALSSDVAKNSQIQKKFM